MNAAAGSMVSCHEIVGDSGIYQHGIRTVCCIDSSTVCDSRIASYFYIFKNRMAVPGTKDSTAVRS